MIVKSLSVMIAVFLLCSVAAAQSYSIRVTNKTNLRATYSTRSRIVEAVPSGTTLQVISTFNRWFKINRNGNDVWMADWVAYTRVEGGQQTQSQTQTSPQIDNCCFVDRQCQSDQEWTDGYWAFQNGQCTAPIQVQTTATQPTGGEQSQVNNCCFTGWNCATDDDWVAGFHGYQTNQCKHRGLALEGSEAFVVKIEQALDLLKDRAPAWYAYSMRGLDRIKEVPESVGAGVRVTGKTFSITPSHARERPGELTAIWLAGIIVHDACHVNLFDAGLPYSDLPGERACLELQIEALSVFNPTVQDPFGLRSVLENIENPEYQWWLD